MANYIVLSNGEFFWIMPLVIKTINNGKNISYKWKLGFASTNKGYRAALKEYEQND
jgi:hypothetical protein